MYLLNIVTAYKIRPLNYEKLKINVNQHKVNVIYNIHVIILFKKNRILNRRYLFKKLLIYASSIVSMYYKITKHITTVFPSPFGVNVMLTKYHKSYKHEYENSKYL